MRRGRISRPIRKQRGGRRYRRALTLPGLVRRRAGLTAVAAFLHGFARNLQDVLSSPRVLAASTSLASTARAVRSFMGNAVASTGVAVRSAAAVSGRIVVGSGRLCSVLFSRLALGLVALRAVVVRDGLALWRVLSRWARRTAAIRLPNIPGGDPVSFGLTAGAVLILVAGLVVLAGSQLRQGDSESGAVALLPDRIRDWHDPVWVPPPPEPSVADSGAGFARDLPYETYGDVEVPSADTTVAEVAPPTLDNFESPDTGEDLAAAAPLLGTPEELIEDIGPVLPERPQERPLVAPEPPQWLANAVQPGRKADGPVIAIVIDDAGVAQARTRRAIELPSPLTIAFIPYSGNLEAQTRRARQRGHELLVHIPMEPSTTDDPGKNALLTTLDSEEIMRRFRWALARFDGYVGVNNHMGSKFMARADLVEPLLAEMNARGLLFLDSRTMATTVGAGLARGMDLPHASRNVFIDNDLDAGRIAAQLAQVERVARRKGHAIAIGHPHDVTVDVLAEWIPQARARGFTFVPVSAVVRLEYGGEVDLAAVSAGGEPEGFLGRAQ